MAQIQQGLTERQTEGTGASLPRYCALLAEAYRSLGHIALGLTVLTEAQEFINQHDERAYAAEISRLRGEFLLAQHDTGYTAENARRTRLEAEACFQQALIIARGQQAKVLELRATMSLSRLWQQGKGATAHALLATAYNWFTEGFDTADLQEARELLKVLEA